MSLSQEAYPLNMENKYMFQGHTKRKVHHGDTHDTKMQQTK